MKDDEGRLRNGVKSRGGCARHWPHVKSMASRSSGALLRPSGALLGAVGARASKLCCVSGACAPGVCGRWLRTGRQPSRRASTQHGLDMSLLREAWRAHTSRMLIAADTVADGCPCGRRPEPASGSAMSAAGVAATCPRSNVMLFCAEALTTEGPGAGGPCWHGRSERACFF